MQIFNIAPPHISSMRDLKNSSGAGLENRMNIKVVGQMPKLEAVLQTPDIMAQGREMVRNNGDYSVVCHIRRRP